MSRPRLATLLLFVVAVVGLVDPGLAVAEISRRGHHHHPPLLHCGPAPVLSKSDDATFRANLAAALAALPSAAAAKRDAFATVHVGSAFTRGACFGANVTSSPATARACEACLSAAERDVTGGCRNSGRAGVWRNECFLSYAESNVSSPREDAFRSWFYAAPRTNATLAEGGACLPDRADDCDRCLRDSARAAAALGWLQRIRGEEVIVVGYSCVRRARISSLPAGPGDSDDGSFVLSLWLHLMFEAGAVIVALAFIDIIKAVRALPQVNG